MKQLPSNGYKSTDEFQKYKIYLDLDKNNTNWLK